MALALLVVVLALLVVVVLAAMLSCVSPYLRVWLLGDPVCVCLCPLHVSFNPPDAPEVQDQVGGAAGHPRAAEDAQDEYLHCDFHLTRVKRLEDLPESMNVRPEVQQCLRFGRPNLPAVFKRMAEIARAKGETRVAVLSCGPAGLLTAVKKLSWSASTKDVHFDFHGETFDF